MPVNDTEIAYRELGHGRPLVLLHGGLVSASDAFAATPISYAGHLERLARTFRVIAPDTRAAGGTRHPGGPASATLLCDDVAALIEALGLERPLVAGFSEGGLTALLLGIRHPDAVGAIVSDAGYDMLNPDAPAFDLLHQMLGAGLTPTSSTRSRLPGRSPRTRRWPMCWACWRPRSSNDRVQMPGRRICGRRSPAGHGGPDTGMPTSLGSPCQC